ncbi:MAG: hypothetical protein OEW27_07985 [Aquincola sp.]|nr:hypothetical protein [Aquincola sp.]MDH5329875.1 hypothetical protein [Aquincola sp.]
MTPDGLAGRLVLRPGADPSVCCERPMVGAELLQRLTAGRHAALLPDIIGAVFTLCADAQRSTSRRALRAALGTFDSDAERARDARPIALHTVREHLQRFTLDMPTLAPDAAAAVTAHWLRDAPVMSVPPMTGNAFEAALAATEVALPGWLERRLFGMAPAAWLAAWQRDPAAWLDEWSRGRDHPVARWLAAVRDDARAIGWPCRPLDVLTDAEGAMRTLAAAIAADPAFAECPTWQGATAETGPWTRHGRVRPVSTAWDRLGARLAEVAQLAVGTPLAAGAMATGDGEGIAWTEMSRGLLIHWVRLEAGERDAGSARAARYQVLAPTEWNFHPQGAFAHLLRDGVLAPAQVRLAAATLDPCLAFTVEAENHHA